jgi:hypothetical protein
MVIDTYSICGYKCFLGGIILRVIIDYFINGYWWLFY